MNNLMDDLKPFAIYSALMAKYLQLTSTKKEQQNDTTIELIVSALNLLFPEVEGGMWFGFFLSQTLTVSACVAFYAQCF